jgi:hypothetical protein
MVQDYQERKINVTKYVAVFAIATLFFIAGLLFGQWVTNSKYENVKAINQQLVFDLQDLEVQSALATNYPCDNYALYYLGDRIDSLGAKITALEDQLGKNNNQVIELKKPYDLLLVKHYLMIKERIEKCNENYTIILFFYSNKPGSIDASEKQGYVLGYFSNKYGYERLKVYSIDADLDLGTVKALKSYYNITVLPTTIVNDKVFVGFHSKEELEKSFS